MTTYRLFPATSGPAAPVTYAGPILLGVNFKVTTSGMWFAGYWHWVPPGGDTVARKFALWAVRGPAAGTVLPAATVTSGTLTAGQWNYVPLTLPILLSIGTAYCAATGWTAVAGFPDSDTAGAGTGAADSYGAGGHAAGITQGPLFAFSNQPGTAGSAEPWGNPNGCFSTAGTDPAALMPAGESNSANFWVDVAVTDVIPTGYAGPFRLWPNKADADPVSGQDSPVNYVVGTQINLTAACTLSKIWYWSPPGTAQLATQAGVWSITTQTLVATNPAPSWSGAAGSGWVSCAFSGVTLPPGQYRVAVYNAAATPDGWNSMRFGYWGVYSTATVIAPAGITNGPMFAPDTAHAASCYEFGTGSTGNQPPFTGMATEAGQSVFAVGPPLQYPALYVDGLYQNYWVDAEVSLASGAPPAGLAAGTGTAPQPAAGTPNRSAAAGQAAGAGTAPSPAAGAPPPPPPPPGLVDGLADGQWQLDGALTFGNGTLIRVQQVSWDPGTPAIQDAPVVQGDGVRMGVDTLPAMALTITGVITAGNGNAGAALDLYETLAAAWLNERVRAVPGAYSVLRIRYPSSPGVRAVFGRGRRIAPTLGAVRQGVLPFTAEFDCASPYFYADTDTAIVLTMMPSDIAGAVNIHNRYLNQTFDTDASNWQGTGCALAWDAAHFRTTAGSLKITPAGATPGVYASGNLDNADLINTARAYTCGLWALAPATLTVPVQAAIGWYGPGGTPISVTTGPPATLTPGTWTFLPAPGTPPSGAVTADPRLAYTGTPASSDVIYLDDAAFIENLGGIAPPVTPPVVLGGTGETAGATAVTGARAAWPVFTITGPVTNPQVAYPATGQWMRLAATLAPGQAATIDTRPWQRTVLRNDGASLAGSLRGNLLRDMALAPGLAAIRFTGQDATGTARCTVTWRPPSGSIGGSS